MILPYVSETPISRKVKEFDTVDDIYKEIACIQEQHDGTRTMGQEMWYLVPLFANPKYLLNDFSFNLINEFHYIQDYNIPLGKSLGETDAFKLEYFTIIKNERVAALGNKQAKNAKR